MRLEGNEHEIVVILSEKNLMAGLRKLQMEDSARTIYSEDADSTELNRRLTLKFETDVEHYTHESRPMKKPGIMHPDTEKFIQGE